MRKARSPGPIARAPRSVLLAPGGPPELTDVLDHRPSSGALERTPSCRHIGAPGGNWSRAARLLGISRRTLYDWKREYGLDEVRSEPEE